MPNAGGIRYFRESGTKGGLPFSEEKGREYWEEGFIRMGWGREEDGRIQHIQESKRLSVLCLL